MPAAPLVTVAVPSFNQGVYLDKTLSSLNQQNIALEIFVADGGSTDNSLAVIKKWGATLAGWRSHKDEGQAAAINECIAKGSAPYVCWLNSDDWLLPRSLNALTNALQENSQLPAAYGKSWDFDEISGTKRPAWVEPFKENRLALRCIISQPATLIRRTAWDAIGGVDPKLRMAMDYDLWWRLYKNFGPLKFVDEFVAVNRVHLDTKTNTARRLHYKEAISIIRRHHKHVPLKWWLAQPYSVWFKALKNKLSTSR